MSDRSYVENPLIRPKAIDRRLTWPMDLGRPRSADIRGVRGTRVRWHSRPVSEGGPGRAHTPRP